MARGKKSFVLYADLLNSVEHLTDEELGQLFKHILLYVNDKNPVMEDRLLLTAWKPIERSLKDDLKKWEKQLKQRSEAGKKSAESRKRKLTSVNDRQQASTDSVTVSVSDSVSVNEIKDTFNFKASLVSLGCDSYLVSEWLQVRSKKKASNTETAFNGWKNQVDKTSLSYNAALKLCVENSWSGFKSDWVNKPSNGS